LGCDGTDAINPEKKHTNDRREGKHMAKKKAAKKKAAAKKAPAKKKAKK